MYVLVIGSTTPNESVMMKVQANKHVWWIGAAALAGGLCVMNACGGAGSGSNSETEKDEQLVFSSVEIVKIALEKRENCAKKGRFTTCWLPGNGCTWYSNMIEDALGKIAGSCYLDCLDLSEKNICDVFWHCDFDHEKNKCVKSKHPYRALDIENKKEIIRCISYAKEESCQKDKVCFF